VAALIVGSLAVSAVACVWMGVLALAAAASGDRRAIASYVRAADSFVRARAAEIGATVTAINAEAAKIEGGCPSVLVGAPRGRQLNELAVEPSGAVLFSGAVPDRGAMLLFARQVSGLRWRDGRVTRLVRSLASEERAIANLVIPDVCADLRAWVASGYRTLSYNRMAFLKQANAIGNGVGAKEESLNDAILPALRPHESSGEKVITKHSQRLEEVTGKRALQAFAGWMKAVE
jgi:hypothetical protein